MFALLEHLAAPLLVLAAVLSALSVLLTAQVLRSPVALLPGLMALTGLSLLPHRAPATLLAGLLAAAVFLVAEATPSTLLTALAVLTAAVALSGVAPATAAARLAAGLVLTPLARSVLLGLSGLVLPRLSGLARLAELLASRLLAALTALLAALAAELVVLGRLSSLTLP